MIQTSTPDLDFTAKETQTEQKPGLPEIAEPSERTIQNILNYSRNLEVKQSMFIKDVEILKS